MIALSNDDVRNAVRPYRKVTGMRAGCAPGCCGPPGGGDRVALGSRP